MVSHSDHKACCSIPPVVSSGYETKGKYEQLADTKTYVTGPSDATKAILYVFDIFGFFPQTLQGADILAAQKAPNNYLVVMPDFFDGKPADINIFPPKNDDDKKALSDFFAQQGAPPKTVKRLPSIVKAVEEKYPSVKEWGIVGFCWGGKVTTLTLSEKGTKFKVGAIAHPAMLDPKEAPNIQVPIAVLASKDESAEDVKKFEEALTVDKHVEIFGDQIHGWMAARSNLSDARNEEEYERGYSTFLEFICKHL